MLYSDAQPGLIYQNNSANTLKHSELKRLLQKAYSAEKAASSAYQGHAASVKNKHEKMAVNHTEVMNGTNARKR